MEYNNGERVAVYFLFFGGYLFASMCFFLNALGTHSYSFVWVFKSQVLIVVLAEYCGIYYRFLPLFFCDCSSARRKNVTNHVIYVRNRHRLVNAGLAMGIIFWSVIVSGIQTLSQKDTLSKVPLFVVFLSVLFSGIPFFVIVVKYSTGLLNRWQYSELKAFFLFFSLFNSKLFL